MSSNNNGISAAAEQKTVHQEQLQIEQDPTPVDPTQYQPITHQYFHHYKQQQQQYTQQQQPSLQQQQQPQRCVLHIPIQPQPQQQQSLQQQKQQQPQQQHYFNNSNNLTYNNFEFDDFYWKNQQQQLQNNCNNSSSNMPPIPGLGNDIGGASEIGSNIIDVSLNVGSGKTYITPVDIPTPPPHPPNIIGDGGSGRSSRKRFPTSGRHSHIHPRSNTATGGPASVTAGRCHCEHPIEIVQPPPTPPPPPILPLTHTLQSQQQQQQNHISQTLTQLRQQHRINYPPPATAAAAAAAQQVHDQYQHPLQHQHKHHHHQHLLPREHFLTHNKNHHRNPDQPVVGTASSSASYFHKFMVGGSGGSDSSSLKNGYSTEKKRKIRIILGCVATIVILGLIAVAVVLVIQSQNYDNGSKNDDANSDGKKSSIYLEDVLSGKFAAHSFNGSWSGTGSTLIYKENNSIVEYDVKSNTKKALLYDIYRQYLIYEKSADGQLLLLAQNYKKNFRHSFEAEYDIYNISSGQIHPLKIKGSRKFVSLVRWAPVGNGLIINFERNLYYKPTAFADEITITTDENLGILYGVTDWVYEEEVFSSNAATWFNPNGTQIAFIKFDDTSTHLINLQYYGEAGDINFQYPLNRYVTYPKSGSSNPRVTLYIADLVRAAEGLEFLTEVPVPSALNTETDFVITVVEWLDNDNVMSVWMNRVQNRAYVQGFDGLKRREIYSMESKTSWIDLFYVPLKNRDGSRIALKLSQPQGADGSEYRHLCILSTKTFNNNVEVLTSGKYVVQQLLHWDVANDVIFYMANTLENPESLHLYAIKAQKGEKVQCLTCNLHKSGDVVQTYFSADFDNTENVVMIASLGPGIPMSDIYEWTYTTKQITLKKLLSWEHNEHLRTKLKDIHMPTIEIHTIPISEGFTAQVLLQLPPNIDRSGNRKYAMLVDVYGGPDSSAVTSRWSSIDWDTYLSSNHSVIIAKIDGRGSNLRGDKLLHSIYHKMGTIEIYDQIHVTKQLVDKFSFIDEQHIGIWGWSYGGYAAAMALGGEDKSINKFKCGASVAPVTDWAYYDSIYTERYMGLPKDNEKAYNDSRLSTRGSSLIGKQYLLIHGTLDDNVHYQQAMMFAKNLEHQNILFKQISYPDEDHGLISVRPHLYHSLDKFFGECFDNKRMMRWGK